MWRQFWAFVQSLPYLTQATHFFAGMAVVLAAALWLQPVWAAGIFFALCAFKELVVDAAPWGEDHGAPDVLDLTFYGIGIAVALGVLWIRGVPLIQ